MLKITPNLWFDQDAETAARFYTSLFPDSKIDTIAPYDQATAAVAGQAAGSAMTVAFELAGQPFVGLNGGPHFKFNPAISFHAKCATKAAVNELWGQLSEGGEVLMPLDAYPFSERYGWCNDRYGLSWQVIWVGEAAIQQQITPVLMFVGAVCGQAEEAINFYTAVFDHTSADIVARYGKGEEPDKEGTVKYASFTLAGQEFGAMDSAQPHDFSFNEALSFIVDCQDQAEVDYFWETLTADGGAESMCGWLKDKYGLSWQIIPQQLRELIGAENKEKAGHAMQAMLKMKKINIATLQAAYEG